MEAVKDPDLGEYSIPPKYAGGITKPRILILDDGMNFGNTMLALFYAVKVLEPKDIQCCVFLNRICGVSERVVDKIIGNRLKYLYRLFFPHVYRPRDCPLCEVGVPLKRIGG